MTGSRTTLALLLVLALPPALAATPASAVTLGCGDPITANTTLSNDLADCPGDGIVIAAPNITLNLDGHTVDGTGGGVGINNLAGHDGVTIRNGIVREFENGVELNDATRNRVLDITSVSNSNRGIRLLRSNLCVVRDSDTANNTRIGIALRGSDDNTVERNTMNNDFQGIVVQEADDNRLLRNTATNNTLWGIDLATADHNQVVANTVMGNFIGIALGAGNDTPDDGSDDNDVRANLVDSSSSDSVLVDEDSNGNRFGRNTVRAGGVTGFQVRGGSDDNVFRRNGIFHHGSGAGIGVTGSVGSIIEWNKIGANNEGVALTQGSDGSRVAFNDLRDNAFAGVNLIDDADDNDVAANKISGSLFGILVQSGSDDNKIHGNAISGSGFNGMDLSDSSGTVVSRNRVQGSAVDGIGVGAGMVDTLLLSNTAWSNKDDGIHVDSASTTIEKNTANFNTALGINAVSGVTDGGGNKAKGNGNPAQCTGVVCA